MEAEELLKYMLNFFQNTDKQLNNKNEELKEIDMQQQDILHYIEARNLNAGGYAKAGKLLKDVRAKRRKIKNDIEQMELIQIFTRKYNNKMIQGDLIQTLKGLSTINKRQAEPKYICRTNILKGLEDKHDNKNTAYVQIKKEQSTNFSK
jgi:hypothetical protein